MALIKSISGIRGTIGGQQGENLTPLDIVKFTTAYASIIKRNTSDTRLRVVTGRDARVSGEMVSRLVTGTLQSMGIDVIDVGLSTTPTVEMEVVAQKANGGIILTASHNPAQWNALKLLDDKGEFFSAALGQEVLQIADNMTDIDFTSYDKLGSYQKVSDAIDRHIEAVLRLKLVDVQAIRAAKFSVAVDCVNSTGGLAVPKLLKALGVGEVHELFCEPTGIFEHNPEPLPEHLTAISDYIKQNKIDVGFVVDPDVDRLAIMQEDGSCFGEEYTLVSIADYILQHQQGNTVSNLSSTQALELVTRQRAGQYFASAVGEVNVVAMMKQCHAVIGGEGNGGVIYPPLHYGRDALVGIALFLTALATSEKKCSTWRASLPNFFIAKNKIALPKGVDVDAILKTLQKNFSPEQINDCDGLRINFDRQWVHLRKSNTEPIIRIYSEAADAESAQALGQKMIKAIKALLP